MYYVEEQATETKLPYNLNKPKGSIIFSSYKTIHEGAKNIAKGYGYYKQYQKIFDYTDPDWLEYQAKMQAKSHFYNWYSGYNQYVSQIQKGSSKDDSPRKNYTASILNYEQYTGRKFNWCNRFGKCRKLSNNRCFCKYRRDKYFKQGTGMQRRKRYQRYDNRYRDSRYSS